MRFRGCALWVHACCPGFPAPTWRHAVRRHAMRRHAMRRHARRPHPRGRHAWPREGRRAKAGPREGRRPETRPREGRRTKAGAREGRRAKAGANARWTARLQGRAAAEAGVRGNACRCRAGRLAWGVPPADLSHWHRSRAASTDRRTGSKARLPARCWTGAARATLSTYAVQNQCSTRPAQVGRQARRTRCWNCSHLLDSCHQCSTLHNVNRTKTKNQQ